MKSYLFTCSKCGTQMAFTEHQAGLKGPCGGCGIEIQAPPPFQSHTVSVGQFNEEAEELSRKQKDREPTPGKLVSPQGNCVTLVGEYIRFGSSSRCDVVVAECYGVSEDQFRLGEEGDRHILVNLAPNENQTRVNAMAVCERPLRDHDVIFAGQLRLTYYAPTIRQVEFDAKAVNRQRYIRAGVIAGIGLFSIFLITEMFQTTESAKVKLPETRPQPKIVMPGKPVPAKPAPRPAPAPAPMVAQTPQDAAKGAYPAVMPGKIPQNPIEALPYDIVRLPDKQLVQNVRSAHRSTASLAHVTSYEETVVNHYVQVLVDAYLKHGDRNWRWDREAITALTLFARIYTGEGVAFSRGDFEEMKASVMHCIREGCRDAAILHAQERINTTEAALSGRARRVLPSVSPDQMAIAAYPAEVQAPSYLHKMRAEIETANASDQRTLMEQLISSTAEWNVDSEDPYMSTVYWDHVENSALSAVEVMDGNWKQVVNRFVNAFKMHSAGPEVRDVFAAAVPIWLVWESTVVIEGEAGEHELEQLGVAKLKLEELWGGGLRMPIICELMLKVSLLGGESELFELWFDRSIELNPEDPTPYRLKAEFLSPRHHGDVEQLTAFADELIENMDAPNLPWLGLEVYTKLNDIVGGDFGKRPEIFQRVESTFDTFFKRYPDAHFRQAQRAAISWKMGYEDEAREQLMESGLDYSVFTQNFVPAQGEMSPHEEILKEAAEAEFRLRLEGAILGAFTPPGS